MRSTYSVILRGKAVFWIVAVLFTGIGLVFAFLVPSLVMESGPDTVRATARVVSVSEKNGMFYTTVEFTADGTKTVRAQSSTSSNYRRAEGSTVSIVYKKSHPGSVSFTDDIKVLVTVFSILGWIFTVIGGVILLMTIASLYLRIKSPQNEDTFYWWINFTGGMMGALVFALPSTFIYPLFTLLPSQVKQQAQNTTILLPVFTAVGILVCTGIFFIGRNQYRKRPQWK